RLRTGGVNTLSTRQSSPSAGALRRVRPIACGAVGPYASASRVSVHGDGFIGARNRFFPAVVAPYGMPLKILTPSSAVPRTLPDAVVETTLPVSAWTRSNHGPAYTPAINSAASLTTALRVEMRALVPPQHA